MRCLACGAEMRLMQVSLADAPWLGLSAMRSAHTSPTVWSSPPQTACCQPAARSAATG